MGEALIASHNLMDGLRLSALLEDHQRLHRSEGLDVLCVQENRATDGVCCAGRIGDALGGDFANVGSGEHPRLAMVINRARLEVVSQHIVELPMLAKLSRLERLFTSLEQKAAQVVTLAPRDGGQPFTVINFHLDTAGANDHRQEQVRAIAAALIERGDTRVVACGDTNAFAARRERQLAALRRVLDPLTELGATDPSDEPTHYFARQREPKLPHRIGVLLGRLGFDMPGRYDVVCSNLPAVARGQLRTPDSDHDLVWARVQL